MSLRGSLFLCIVLLTGSHRCTRADIILGIPQKLPAPVNTTRIDASPVILPDGNTMLFSSNRAGTPRLWQVTRTHADVPWEAATRVGEINNTVRATSVSADGLELYFAEGWRPFNSSNIWVSSRESQDAPWGEPERLGPTINGSGGADGPVISSDRLSLYFSSNRPGGHGGNDIYVARRTTVNDEWGEARNLGPEINSPSHDWMNGLTQDGRTLYFSSFRSGLGVHVATRAHIDEEFSNPLRLPEPVNVPPDAWSLRPSPDESSLFYTTGHNNNIDIWEVPLIPFGSVPIDTDVGSYRQNFDAVLGDDGTSEATLPIGWTATDGNAFFHLAATNRAFPTNRVTGSEPHLFNAGHGDDRALAIYVPKRSEEPTLQLLAKAAKSEANAIRLQFDIEAWDNVRGRGHIPGEAAFDVTVDIDRGNGFEPLANLGPITTGEILEPSDNELLDGNDDTNRVSHDSGMIIGSIPEDAELRVRWKADVDGQTEDWLFGLDNVELSLHFLGDFDNDGMLSSGDIDLLSSAVRDGTQRNVFDLTGDGALTHSDHEYWIQELVGTLPGDADLDGKVAFEDFLALSENFGSAGGWAQGDFDGSGDIRFDDFVTLSAHFGQTVASTAAVPEPSSGVLLWLFGLLAASRRRCRCRMFRVAELL